MRRVGQIISVKLFIAYRIWKTSTIAEGDIVQRKTKQNEPKSNMIDSWKLSIVACKMQYEHHFDQHMSKQIVCCFFLLLLLTLSPSHRRSISQKLLSLCQVY